MALIEFKNLPDTSTPINAENLISMQKLDYAVFSANNFTMSNITQWQPTNVPMNSSTNKSFITSNSSVFSQSGDYINCNFTGSILIMRQISHNYSSELDINDNLGNIINVGGYTNIAMSIKDVNPSDAYIGFSISGGATDLTIYNARIVVIRLK